MKNNRENTDKAVQSTQDYPMKTKRKKLQKELNWRCEILKAG